MKKLALSILLGAIGTMIGILFRPFWLSPWGPPAFIALVWLLISATASWRGKSHPLAIRFGVVVGTGIALSLLVTFYSNPYVGIAVLVLLSYLGFKAKFFGR